MPPIIQEASGALSPESLVERLQGEPGIVLLRSGRLDAGQGRYSFVVARPMLMFRSFGARCELAFEGERSVQFGNPWSILQGLLGRFELLDEVDVPFPLGGCFGYWGYDLKSFLEPRLPRGAANDVQSPDCHLGFYDSLVVFDHALGKSWIVSTGLQPDGARSERRTREQLEFWRHRLLNREPLGCSKVVGEAPTTAPEAGALPFATDAFRPNQLACSSTFSREQFVAAVERAQRYIRAGDIYQVNLAQRLTTACHGSGWDLFRCLSDVSPAPFAAYLNCGDFELASSSPELFLQMSGAHIQTRPIKGTRPRSADPDRDAQLTYELQTSPKEMAELVMITDLLRNDLGKVCEYGSVRVPELVRLERYAHVQHLVSTVTGQLRSGLTHLEALAAGFPGGSITGAPKIRAMEIIDEMEPVIRGPYTGCLGYLGFNRESQLSIIIRTALWRNHTAHFHVGAGIVADSSPEAEYEETLAKAQGFLAAMESIHRLSINPSASLTRANRLATEP